MSIVNKLLQRVRSVSAKQLTITGVFTLALVSSIGLGLVTRQYAGAEVIRDTDPVNSIDGCSNNGGIGAADANELIKDIKDGAKCRADLATIYADSRVGLTSDKYTRFAGTAQEGYIWRDGHVTVGNDTVMTGVSTMGRTTMGKAGRQPIKIGNTTYYYSTPDISFAQGRDKLPALVMFDNQGVVEVAIMKPCGNPILFGQKVKPTVTCNTLNHVQKDSANKPNEYTFTTNASFAGNAKLSKLVYHFSDGSADVTTHSLTEEVTRTFTKDTDVTVTVYATVPGGHEIHTVVVEKCKYHVTHVAPKAVCTALVPTVLDDKKQKFRFTVKVSIDKNVTVKNAEYTVDGKNNVTETTKDSDGNIYREYTFTDDQKHTVSVTVHFTTVEGDKTDVCKAEVTSKKTPVCTVPGHEGQPVDDKCGYCLPNIPIGSPECTPKELVHTGPGGVFGLFAGTSALGALGHHFVVKRRASRREQ